MLFTRSGLLSGDWGEKMKRVALVSSRTWFGKSREDQGLEAALCNAGIHAEILCWEDPVPWQRYDLVILRSPWDYYLRYEAFCLWLVSLREQGVNVANGVDRILKNISKTTQLEQLKGCGIQPVPSCMCSSEEDVDAWLTQTGCRRFVVKPDVSASGHNTCLIDVDGSPGKWSAAISKILSEGRAVIVQPFIPEVGDGELSLIYFLGSFSHAVLRHPGVLADKRHPEPVRPEIRYREAGDRICSFLGGQELLYARVDLVGHHGRIHIMEVELAEPDLYLTLDYPSVGTRPIDAFIRCILKLLDCQDGGNR